MTSRPDAARHRLLRFDRTERLVHWVTAVLFGILVLTALPLYVPGVAAMFGRRHLFAEVHVAAGLALPVPFLLAALACRRGRALRRDVSRLNGWSRDDTRWVRTLGRDPFVSSGKFNGGQKLNAAFTAGAALVMIATGVVMWWFGIFPLSWRTGATFVHDVLAFVLVLVVAGHVSYALRDPEALGSMRRGWISRDWARSRAPRWLAEIDREDTPKDEVAEVPKATASRW